MFNVSYFDVFGWLWSGLLCAIFFDQGRRYERKRARELREAVLEELRLSELDSKSVSREPTLGDWKF